jgi:hypothetical protein
MARSTLQEDEAVYRATAATGKTAVEAVVFTRNGDHGYDDAAVEAEARVERARRVVESLPSGAVVMSRHASGHGFRMNVGRCGR